MYWFGAIAALVGVVMLVLGFVKNNRVILVAAGLVLFIAGAGSDFYRGVVQGYRESQGQHAQSTGPSA